MRWILIMLIDWLFHCTGWWTPERLSPSAMDSIPNINYRDAWMFHQVYLTSSIGYQEKPRIGTHACDHPWTVSVKPTQQNSCRLWPFQSVTGELDRHAQRRRDTFGRHIMDYTIEITISVGKTLLETINSRILQRQWRIQTLRRGTVAGKGNAANVSSENTTLTNRKQWPNYFSGRIRMQELYILWVSNSRNSFPEISVRRGVWKQKLYPVV